MLDCPYCQRNFRGDAALNTHLGKCNARKRRGAAGSASAAQVLQQEAANFEAAAAAEAAAADLQQPDDAIDVSIFVFILVKIRLNPPRCQSTNRRVLPALFYVPAGFPTDVGVPLKKFSTCYRRHRRRRQLSRSLNPCQCPPPMQPLAPPLRPSVAGSRPPRTRTATTAFTRTTPPTVLTTLSTLDELCATDELLAPDVNKPPSKPWYFPFANPSIAHVMMWKTLTDNANSDAGTDSIVDIFLLEDVKKEELQGFNSKTENDRLDRYISTPSGEPSGGWQRGSVTLKVPCPGVRTSEVDAFEYTVNDIYHRPLLDLLTEVLQSPAFRNFHLTPFEPRWNPNHDPRHPDEAMDDDMAELDEHGLPPLPPGHQRVYGEVYNSPRMLKAHKAFEEKPPSNVERVLVALMPFSDATHLTNYGNASLWPLYMFMGNFSKELRGKPTENLAFHQAYFPSVS